MHPMQSACSVNASLVEPQLTELSINLTETDSSATHSCSGEGLRQLAVSRQVTWIDSTVYWQMGRPLGARLVQ